MSISSLIFKEKNKRERERDNGIFPFENRSQFTKRIQYELISMQYVYMHPAHVK